MYNLILYQVKSQSPSCYELHECQQVKPCPFFPLDQTKTAFFQHNHVKSFIGTLSSIIFMEITLNILWLLLIL